MSAHTLTPSQLHTQVALVQKYDERNRKADSRFIGVKSNGHWQGGELLVVGELSYRVVQCASVLELREALVGAEATNDRLVILTSVEQSDLGDDVLARLAKRCLFTLRPWPSVIELFHARIADPNLTGKRWLAEALLDDAPPQGYPPVPGGVLDEETVWGAVLRGRFGFDIVRPDAQDLLEWSLDVANVARYESAPPELQKGLREWTARSAGKAGELIFRCADAGFGRDAAAVGLACQVIFGDDASPELREAAIRFERFVGGSPAAAEDARQWAAASGSVVEKLALKNRLPVLRGLLERSDQILDETRAGGFAHLGRYSPAGFEQRLEQYGKRLHAALKSDVRVLPADLAGPAAGVLDHAQSRQDSERALRVEMSLRLLRWLSLPDIPENGSLEEATRRYAADGGFVDWARNYLYGGERVDTLSKAYALLAKVAGERREAQDRRFGELLANWTGLGSPGDSVLKIEEVMRKVVAEVGRSAPVLLVVVDGMSWAVMRELLDDVSSRGWVNVGRDEADWGRPVIAVLPSVTQVSRTSLLCGRLATGSSADEINGFKSNADLLKWSKAGSPPVLYHKGTLSETAGAGLSAELIEKIASDKTQFVGVVVNAVDDFLGKGDQVNVPWTLKSMPVLDQLLYAARDAGRAVVLTSDHGHVLERQSTYRKADAGERYRADDGNPLEGELAVAGDRVLLPQGNRLIAPWGESLRYGTKKHGYHGGLSPQECVVPLAVVAWPNRVPTGWTEMAAYRPDWWEASMGIGGPTVASSTATVPVVTRKEVRAQKTDASLPLFAAEGSPPAKVEASWIDALLTSTTFAGQSKLAGRAAPPPELVRAFLGAVEERGGTILKGALAQKLGLPELRINGVLAAMRRLLNVEGYGVLSVEDASGTVTLNAELLKVQFELE